MVAVNNPKVAGRRFSKVRVLTFGPDNQDELDKHLTEKRPQSLSEVLEYYVEFARSRLQSSGLPCDPVVTWTDKENRKCGGILPSYVISERGYEADSPEGLAAQIIWEAHQLETAEAGEIRDFMLVNLGKLWTLFKTYSITTAGSRKGSKAPRVNVSITPQVLNELAAKELTNKRGAVGIIAKKHNVTPAALRAAKKKKNET